MISSVGSQLNSASLISSMAQGEVEKPSEQELELREKFQDFVAGTFYKQMFKSLRATHDKPAYLHGGQAEEMFQSQLDQQVAEDLAKSQGASFANDLFDSFKSNLKSF